jgi:proteasome component ECM29
MGFPRLPVEKQAELIPAVIKCLDGKPAPHQDSLLLMILPVLDEVKAPEDPEKRLNLLGLNEKAQLKKTFVDFLLNYLLLQYGSHPTLMAANQDPDEDPLVAAARWHPGLCETEWKRVAGPTPVKAEDLEKTKVKILKFLGKGYFSEGDIAMHLIVGTADTRHSVASQADTEIRKLMGVLDWNDPTLVSKIYALFLGTLTFMETPAPRHDQVRIPANTRIRLKLMPYLQRSNEAASRYLESMQVIFDLLFGSGGNTNSKLKFMAVSFIHNVVEHCPSERLKAIGAVLLTSIPKLISEEGDNPKLRASCYVAIGKLGQKNRVWSARTCLLCK